MACGVVLWFVVAFVDAIATCMRTMMGASAAMAWTLAVLWTLGREVQASVGSLDRMRGVHPSDLGLYSGGQFACKDGSKTFRIDRFNDDYCDCVDGSDEPGEEEEKTNDTKMRKRRFGARRLTKRRANTKERVLAGTGSSTAKTTATKPRRSTPPSWTTGSATAVMEATNGPGRSSAKTIA